MNNVKTCDLFEKPIVINEEIAKYFYDLNVENEDYFNAVVEHGNSKKEWEIGFNERISKKVIQLIFKMPALKMICDMWIIDSKSKTITLKINLKNKKEFVDFLKAEAIKTIKKCIPEYSSITTHDLLNCQNHDKYYQKLIENSNISKKSKVRKFQHIFRKKVLDRDKKCCICGLETNYLLEAAHIKPYVECGTNDIEKYSEVNGIALCKNHHKMFDANDFSIDSTGKINFSKTINETDKKILFKNYQNTLDVVNNYNKKYFIYRFSNFKSKGN